MCVWRKKKQDVAIGDNSGTSKVTLWEEHVDSFLVECSYRFENFIVKECASQKYLSMPRVGAKINPIHDLGDVAEPARADATSMEICNVEIIGVPQLDSYKVCLKCKAHVEPLTPPLGRCSKLGCSVMQRYDRCPNQLSSKLMVM